ncbi:MAG TPA: carboxypeptidase-like regulatory domain-containing protein [Terriglobales bacterium]|nr:carboxypeptidase-like regulatory domain-containing protein [Terriglobales bacterium]
MKYQLTRQFGWIWTVLLLLLGLAGQAFGQEAGTIVGTVTDPSDAAIPNVAITVTNTSTGQVRHLNTTEAGQYVVPDLHIGHYTIRAEAPGFKTAERTDVVLTVGDRARVDLKLELGSTTETVNVEAKVVTVQSESGEVSDVITGQQVSQLATNGRSIYSLATLTAGASSNMVDFQNPVPVGGDGTVSFNGLRVSHNLYMVDGGEDYDRGGSGNISIMPSVDSIAEFRALTSNYSADFGLSSAGTLTMVFKSGTKDLHASAWEFLRNDKLDAGNFFTNAAGQKAPELRFNTYGFNVGGPVIIPKIYNNRDRNKTFFFYNMEWRKLVQGGVVNQTVPLGSEYGGQINSPIHVPNANQLSPALQGKYAALGLAPGQAFPNNTIPASLLDPNAQVLLGAGIFPAANNGAQFVGGNKLPTDVREEIIRIDHQFSEKFWIFGHWVDEAISQAYGTSQWSGDNVPTASDIFGNPSYSGVIHATYSISPTLLNETSFNYNGNRINIVPKGNIVRPSSLTIPELFTGNNLNRIPGISLGGSTGTNFDVSSWPWKNKADDYQIRDDVSWTRGSHQLKIGGSWAIYKKVQDLFGDTQGAFSFNGSYTGNDFADFLLGYSNSYTELAVQDHGYWDNVSWAAYVQDNWRVNTRLTLNLGLRWDGVPHTYEEHNRMSNFYPGLFNPANAAIILPSGNISPNSPGLGTSPNPILNGVEFYLNGIGIAGQNGIPNGLVKNHWAAFGPRVGFAYDLTGQGKTVVRGGFGIMYERIQGNDMYNAGPNEPFSTNVTFNNVSLSNPNLSLLTGQTLTAPITVGSITGLAYTDYKLPASYQYSVGVQQQLGNRSVVAISYVGNTNRHQNDYRETNLPPTSVLPALINGTVAYNTVVPYLGFHSIQLSENAQNSHYNSLQVNLHAQVKNNLSLQFAYTLSRVIDPGGSSDLSGVSNPYNRAYDIGPGGLDRTHIALINFIYQIPLFNSSQSRLVKSTLGGWEVSGIVTAETGLPLFINLGGSQGSNGLANATNRPDWTGHASYPQTVDQWFNPAAFSVPALGAWGNFPNGAVRQPGRDNWNVSLFKSFVFSERRGSKLEFRVESFNTFNHTQFNGISSTFAASNFGAVTSVWDPRVFQMGLKLLF